MINQPQMLKKRQTNEEGFPTFFGGGTAIVQQQIQYRSRLVSPRGAPIWA